MKVGDLIGIGWNGKFQQPFVAVIKKIHRTKPHVGSFTTGYTVFIPATGLDTFILPSDAKVINESR